MPAEGLLLGFSTIDVGSDIHNRGQELATAWIVRHGNTVQLVAVLPYLFVPRATAFWRVGIEQVCEMYGESNEFRASRDIVWSGPADAVPQLSKGPDCPSKPPSERDTTPSDQQGDGQQPDKYTACMYSDRSISFVSPNYIAESAREGNTEACEARGNRWSAWSRVVSITTPEMKEARRLSYRRHPTNNALFTKGNGGPAGRLPGSRFSPFRDRRSAANMEPSLRPSQCPLVVGVKK